MDTDLLRIKNTFPTKANIFAYNAEGNLDTNKGFNPSDFFLRMREVKEVQQLIMNMVSMLDFDLVREGISDKRTHEALIQIAENAARILSTIQWT